MGHVYTPGLKVTDRTTVRKVRRLPLKGRVLVGPGDAVSADEVVARTDLPGKVHSINAANLLGVMPADLRELMLRHEGHPISEGEPLAVSRGLLGMFRATAKSPVTGTIESISSVTGQVLVREAPIPVEVRAYLRGRVVEVIPDEGVVVEAAAALAQGIFGLGGEVLAPIRVAAPAPDAVLDAGDIRGDLAGQVCVGGALLTLAGFRAAQQIGVAAWITGGFHYHDVKELLGHDLGVAITGAEPLRTTLIITEGFGRIAMARATFDLLRRHEGEVASVSGATQIRAGVIRPEVIIPVGGAGEAEAAPVEVGLDPGAPVRAIRAPHFGRIGTVASLPPELCAMPTESPVRVLEVQFENGERVLLPRANVELIERR